MGHRALVAYERTDGQYTLHYSHWGAADLKLKHRITADTTFGGDDTDATWANQLFTELADGLETAAVDGDFVGEDRSSTVVDPTPRAAGLTLEEIIADHLDYLHHDAFYVVSSRFEVTAYRTLWFGLQSDPDPIEPGAAIGDGALVTVRWHNSDSVGDSYLLGQFHALKAIARDMTDKDVFTPATARQYLKRKLAEWVDNRQELRIPTEEAPFETASQNDV